MANNVGGEIDRAARELNSGHLVAIPTETVYGLAANAIDPIAVAQIFKAKNRPTFDPLIVHCASWEHAQEWVKNPPDFAHQLARELMPGPLTLVLPKSDRIPDIVTAGLPTVAIRVPAHPMTRELLSRLDFPLAAPSANPFGYVSPTTAQHVLDQLGDRLAYVFDGGPCEVGLESTIVAVHEDGWDVLRLGGMDLETIEKAAGCPPRSVRLSSSRPEAPGMLDSHYAPRKPLFFGALHDFIARHPSETYVCITFGTPSSESAWNLSTSGDDREAAANIFRFLRELESHPAEWIVAEPLPSAGLGAAINDRLQRAASEKS